MAWLLLLIQALPAIIDLVRLIMDYIKQLRGTEKIEAKRELFAIAKKHVKKKRAAKPGEVRSLAFGEPEVKKDLAALLVKVQKPQS